MILDRFTVRLPGHYHQHEPSIESDDVRELIRLGEEWTCDINRRYYTIRLSNSDKADNVA